MGTDPSLSLNFLTKPALNCPSFRKHSGVIVGALPSKTKLIHCVLRGSDDRRKLTLVCSSTSQNYKTTAFLTRHPMLHPMSPLKFKYYNQEMKDFESLTVISVEYYCKGNPACFTCLKMVNR